MSEAFIKSLMRQDFGDDSKIDGRREAAREHAALNITISAAQGQGVIPEKKAKNLLEVAKGKQEKGKNLEK